MQEHYFIISTAFSIRERKTQKGVVYDAIFRVFDEDGNSKQKVLSGYASQTLVKKAHTAFITANCTQINRAPNIEKHKILFKDAYAAYLGYAETTLRESTLYSIESTFNLYVLPYFENKNLATLVKRDLYDWQDLIWQAKKDDGTHYSYSYLKRTRSLFNSFLNWCKQRYEIENPLSDIKIPKRIEAQKEMTFWEKSEFDKFISCIDDCFWKTYFMSLYFTGCRVGESFVLSDSDYNGETIHISKTITTKIRGNDKYHINGRKNKKPLNVPIPFSLKQQLDDYLQWKKEHNISNAFLFGGNKPLAGTTVRRVFDNYIALAEVKRIRIHDLRHSYVSLLIHKGANYTVVAELIGDTKEQVIKTYGHIYPSDKQNIVSLLDI